MQPTIRPYEMNDAEMCHRVFFNAVRMGAASHYSEIERAAWAPCPTMPATWPDKLGSHITYVAQVSDIIGFITLGVDGYLDLAFVAPGYMGQGIGKTLYHAVLQDERAIGLTELTTEASHLARPFFESLGWKVKSEQQVERRGVLLTNFCMYKNL